ncbi:Ig-like domain-containing protein [Pedobacter gandavensis]|uniref:Ig-like domain-containing protein n=1 Tax=Pedobacter gandavensis TaxID=2679963 RepID=UPI00292E8C1F|nr:Ig-like domain-containing protein [Pedobacter gandavensis]
MNAKGSTGLLGLLGSPGIAYVNLIFPSGVPLNTIVYAKISNLSLPSSLSTISGEAYTNTTTVAAGSSSAIVYGGDGSIYVAVSATVAFNQVRIILSATGSGLLNSAETAAASVNYAFFNTSTAATAAADCGIPIGTSKSGNGEVTDLAKAIDGSLITHSIITPALLLSSVEQNFYFSSLSDANDEFKVTLSIPPMILSLGVANTITVFAYNGSSTTPVWSKTLGALVSLDLLNLLGNGVAVTTSIKPGAPYDRISINCAAVANVLSALYVHEVQRTPAPPVFTVPNPTICPNTSTTLAVTSSSSTTAKWYDAATDGNLLFTGNSFTTPVLSIPTTYYVSILKNGCTGESIRVPVLVSLYPPPAALPAITGTLSVCVGSTTSLSNAIQVGTWSSTTPTIASVNASGLVTGILAGTATIKYSVSNGNGCISETSINVVVNTQPSIPAISQHHLCVGQSIDLITLNPADANGTTGGSYVWSATPAGAALSSTTVTPPSGNITYYVRYTKDGCFSDSSVLLSLHPKPITPHVTLN